jgi:molecular chaperone GrpE (heat shock protein)
METEENKAQQEVVDRDQEIRPMSGFDTSTEKENPPPKLSDEEDQSGLIPRGDNEKCEELSEEPPETPNSIKRAEPEPLTELEETATKESVSESPVSDDVQETAAGVNPSAERTELLSRSIEEYEQENLDFNKSKVRFYKCLEFASGFRSEIEIISPKAVKIVDDCNVLDNGNLPALLADTVKNSKAGVDLVLKMISRLADRIPKTDTSQNPHEEDLEKPDSEVQGDMAQIKAYCDDLSTRNYARVTAMRRAADDGRQALFSFIKTHFLAIVDGITDGRRHFEQQKNELLDEHPDYGHKIDKWFEVYDLLLELFDDIFLKFEMEPIRPAVGEKADYELHEPFSTVVAPEYADESVHELIRPGYKYTGPLYKESGYVIRPALVVVTKTS